MKQYRRLSPLQRKLQRLDYWLYINRHWFTAALTIVFCVTAQIWFKGMTP